MSQDEQQMINERDEECRRSAVQRLRGTPLKDISLRLFAAMGDESWRVRKEAVNVFISSEPEEIYIDELLEYLRSDDNAGQRNSTAEAVTRLGERAVTPLCRLLHDTDVDVRKFVIDVMGSISSVKFVRPLLDALQDTDINVAAAAAEQLGNIGDTQAVPELLKSIVENKSDFFRFNALASIGKLAVPAPVPEEIRCLAEQEILRKAVYECLGSIADESAVPLLLDGINLPQKSARNAAIIALYRIYSRSENESRLLIENSLQLLKGTDSVLLIIDAYSVNDLIRSEAAISLLDCIKDVRRLKVFLQAFSNDRFAAVVARKIRQLSADEIQYCLSMYDSANADMRAAICSLMGENPCPSAKKLLISALSDSSELVRLAAIPAVGKLGIVECIPELTRFLDDFNQDVRAAAISCLQLLSHLDRSAISNIARTLSLSASSELRRNAAILYASLDDSERLILLAKDEDAHVRQAAVTAISSLHFTSADGILVMALVDEDPDVRIAAAEALGDSARTETLSALLHALNDEDEWVRCAVLKSIYKIDPEQAFISIKTVFSNATGLFMLTCLQLLDALDTTEATQLVAMALDNMDGDVVKSALDIIGRHEPQNHINSIIKLLSHTGWDIRVAAAKCIACLPVPQAREMLTKILTEEQHDPARTRISELLKGLA